MVKIILFYKYVNIEHPLSFSNQQTKRLKLLNLKGRLIISREGINGTLSGREEDINDYEKSLIQDKKFEDIVFKESFFKEEVFPRLSVKIRDEIVSLKKPIDINNKEKKGKYIDIDKFHEIIKNKSDEYVILDARNNYESNIGRFKNAITPDIDNFRDFPKVLKDIKKYKNKKIVMYCTGGVRCEKASSYLIKKGYKNVYQLKDGILNYINYYPDDFEGKCYVFDKRIAVGVLSNNSIISKCTYCSNKSDRYVNCENKSCNKQFIVCTECESKFNKFCSVKCMSKI
jgi:UPF0176 protein